MQSLSRGSGGSLRVVWLRGGSRIADSRPGAVRAKGAAARGVWGHAPGKYLKFRRSKIDSGAFWRQGTRTRCCKSVTLRRTIVIELRPNLDRITPAAPQYNSAELQTCERPDETAVYWAAAVLTRELPRVKVMNIDYLIAEEWSGFGRTSRTGSAGPA